jgi:beta-1,4-mannosyl-glycoprotein beta-1,4-N-acetylglucosaminyltransferase
MPKIVDCFIFNDELDLLELRLKELYPYVEKFVLCESVLTHQYKEKPLHFKENKNRFLPYLDKIVPITVVDVPIKQGWYLERKQRHLLDVGLRGLNPEDAVIIADVDELWNHKVILPYIKSERFRLSGDVTRLNMKHCCYYMNMWSKDNSWYVPPLIRYELLQEYDDINVIKQSYQDKNNTPKFKGERLSDAGWHFSYLGGVDVIIKKLESFAHTEYNTPLFKNRDFLQQAMDKGIDLFRYPEEHYYQKMDKEADFPITIVNNWDSYIEKGFILA